MSSREGELTRPSSKPSVKFTNPVTILSLASMVLLPCYFFRSIDSIVAMLSGSAVEAPPIDHVNMRDIPKHRIHYLSFPCCHLHHFTSMYYLSFPMFPNGSSCSKHLQDCYANGVNFALFVEHPGPLVLGTHESWSSRRSKCSVTSKPGPSYHLG